MVSCRYTCKAFENFIAFIRRFVDRDSQTIFSQMGFQSVRSAKSTVKQQIYLSLGVKAVRGMDRLLIVNLTVTLTGFTYTKVAVARRARAKYMYNEQMNAYWARHYYFDI